MKPQPSELTEEQRTDLLARLAKLPEWGALKDLMKPYLIRQPIDFSNPQWAGVMAAENGKTDAVLTIIRAVEKASDRVRAKETPTV